MPTEYRIYEPVLSEDIGFSNEDAIFPLERINTEFDIIIYLCENCIYRIIVVGY